MSVIIFLIQKIFNFIYIFFKLFPSDDRILFISRQSDRPSLDFRMIIKQIEKISNSKIIIITKRIEKNYFVALKKNFFIMFKQMYHLARAKVCVVDGYNVAVSFLKHKKSLKVIQIWHSLGAIKKFGYQTMLSDRDIKIARASHLHKNYNYIIASSEYEVSFLKKAFNYKNNFKVIGLPRIDYLLKNKNQNRKKIYKKYPEFKNKKVILYAPTFRDDNNYKFEEIIEKVDSDKYILIIKKHPNINYHIKDLKNAYIVNDFSTMQILSIADFVITDYSAISIEAAILDIPVFIWGYDYKNYSVRPGLNIDIKKEFGPYFSESIDDICLKLNKKYDLNYILKFKNKNIKYLDKKVTKRLANFILYEELDYEKVKEFNYCNSKKTPHFNVID